MKNKATFDSTLSKFGIGLFETIKVKDEAINIDYHMDRLFDSIKVLNLNFDYEREYIKKEILKYIKENKIKYKALRLTIFDEGYNICVRDIVYNKENYDRGFKINISPIKRGESILYRHKTTNYFENIYTKNYAVENGYDDGLFLDFDERILECSMSNIYFIKDNIIYTPTSALPILNGTSKRRIIDICDELNIQIKECEIKMNNIKEFDFVFISNSIMELMRVSQIQTINYNKYSDIFKKISAKY